MITLTIVNSWDKARLFVLEFADLQFHGDVPTEVTLAGDNRYSFTLEQKTGQTEASQDLHISRADGLRIYTNNVGSEAEKYGAKGQTLFELTYTDVVLNCDVSAVDGLSEMITYELRSRGGELIPQSDDLDAELFVQNLPSDYQNFVNNGPSQPVKDRHVQRLQYPPGTDNIYPTLLADKYVAENLACARCGLDLDGHPWDGHTFVNVQHNCRVYMHTLQGEDTYCQYVSQLGLGYCWAFDELRCTDGQCGYGDGYPFDSPCDVPRTDAEMRGKQSVALTCGQKSEMLPEWAEAGCETNDVDMQTSSTSVDGSTLTVTFLPFPWLEDAATSRRPFVEQADVGICDLPGRPGMCTGANPVRPSVYPMHFQDLTPAQRRAVGAILLFLVAMVLWFIHRNRRPSGPRLTRPRRRPRRRAIRR